MLYRRRPSCSAWPPADRAHSRRTGSAANRARPRPLTAPSSRAPEKASELRRQSAIPPQVRRGSPKPRTASANASSCYNMAIDRACQSLRCHMWFRGPIAVVMSSGRGRHQITPTQVRQAARDFTRLWTRLQKNLTARNPGRVLAMPPPHHGGTATMAAHRGRDPNRHTIYRGADVACGSRQNP